MSLPPISLDPYFHPIPPNFWNEISKEDSTWIESFPYNLSSSQEAASFSKSKDDTYEIDFNVKNFDLEDLEVKIEDHYLVIHGKHDTKVDAHGIIEREFKRRYPLPADVDTESLKPFLYGGGILHVEIKRLNATKNERAIPITIQKM